MILRLPSGAVGEVREPDLSEILAAGGGARGLAHAAWAHDVDFGRLDEGDVLYLAEWAVDRLIASEDGLSLAIVCARYGQAPSDRLQINNLGLAWALDSPLCLRLAEAEAKATKPRHVSIDTPAEFDLPDPDDERIADA